MAKVDSISLFSNGPHGTNSLDSLTVGRGSLWAEYGNGADSTGAGGSSTIVQYALNGHVRHTYTISGSVDGLKVDPTTGIVWALQNQDGNSTLTLINPATNTLSDPISYLSPPYVYGTNSTHGYDDVAFVGGRVYLSYTNPANPTDPVLQYLVNGHVPFGKLLTTNLLYSNSLGTNLETGQTGQALPISDPDSLKSTPGGGLVLTSGGDNAYTLISHPGTSSQTESFVQLQNLPAGSGLDDVVISNATSGTLYIADEKTNRVLKLHLSDLKIGQANVSVGSEVGTVNTKTGDVTALIKGLHGSHGLAFVADPKPPHTSIAALLHEVGQLPLADLQAQIASGVLPPIAQIGAAAGVASLLAEQHTTASLISLSHSLH